MLKWTQTVGALATLLITGHASSQDFELILPFDPSLGELPESIAIDRDENIYLSMSNTVRRLSSQGDFTVFGALPIPAFALGVKVGPDGCIYVASTSLDPGLPGAFVWRMCEQGETAEVFAELDHSGGPNDLAFNDAGELFVTDPMLGRIYKIDADGVPSLWLTHPLLEGDPVHPALVFSQQGVNGIAFDKKQRNLYVTNLDFGRILRIPVSRHGGAGAPKVFVSDPLLVGADGITFDQKENLYVTVGAQDRLVVIDGCGEIEVLGEGGLLDGPSSVAFGTRGADKRTLYVTSLAFSRAFGFQPGVPHPALLSTVRRIHGLKLN